MDLGIAGLALFTKKGSDCCLLYTIFPGTQQAETLALPLTRNRPASLVSRNLDFLQPLG